VIRHEGQRTLLFAQSALGDYFTTHVDAADRVVSERMVTPNHLLTREVPPTLSEMTLVRAAKKPTP